jgi:hypothetical protein
MGIALETSMLGRPRAAVAAGPMGDEAGQDEDHAGDTDEVRPVLRDQALVDVMPRADHVDDDVHRTPDGHDAETEEHQQRETADAAQELYHQHVL